MLHILMPDCKRVFILGPGLTARRKCALACVLTTPIDNLLNDPTSFVADHRRVVVLGSEAIASGLQMIHYN